MIRRTCLIAGMISFAALGCKAKEEVEVEPVTELEEKEPVVAEPVEKPVEMDMGAAEGKPTTALAVNVDSQLATTCGMDSNDVFFEFDSASLSDDAQGKLDKVAECAKSDKLKGKKLVLVGHASPPGSADYNEDLSKNRSDSIMEKLTEMGVKKDRLEVRAMGEENAPDQLDDQKWPYGRRVDVRVEDRS